MPKEKNPGTQIATTEAETTDVDLNSAKGYLADAGAGFEDTTAADYALPMLGILQKMSPQVDEDQDAHIPGAKAGMVFNTVTQEMYDGERGILFIPVHREHKFVEWVPREIGGGLVEVHAPDSPVVLKAKADSGSDFGKLSLGDNQLAETFYVYGLRVDEDGNTDQAVIPFASTQIRTYKAWMTKARGIKLRDPETNRPFPAPMFAHVYRLTTHLQENKKGKWHGWRVAFNGANAAEARLPLGSPLYDEAKALRDLVTRGLTKINIEQSQGLGGEVVSEEDRF